MVIPYLSPEKIAAGAALLAEFDRARVDVDVALWNYSSDYERWRLVVSMPRLVRRGELHARNAIYDAFEKMAPEQRVIETSDVSLGTGDQEMLTRLRAAGRKKHQISVGRYITNTGLQGMLLEGAYIYRLSAPRSVPAREVARGLRRSHGRKVTAPAAGPTRG